MKGHSLELWGGIECTVNRVKNRFHDQLRFAGHHRRHLSDLDALAELGIKALRYPVLWEHVEPSRRGGASFTAADRALKRLRHHGVEAIAGLLHHGSGPRHTSLLDPLFPEKLAAYAERVARRYPWLRRFTPVNEPLTTARFSALYGHWYPHARDDHSFARAVVNQALGTARAMRAIRRHIPHAELIQTEDLGHVRSTPDLACQAEFENERRFLSLDLLCGAVTPDHSLYDYLLDSGSCASQLQELADQPCHPNIIGFNYYVTGERFLDSRVQSYPAGVVGGNGHARYADVEAVRVCREGLRGPAALLIEAYARFGLPLAITEAHLAGCAEDRARWFSYVWTEAERAAAAGVPVRAVTAWALWGSYGWDELVRNGACSYEPGAFEIKNGRLRETPYANFLRAVSRGTTRVIDGGWWRTDERLSYPDPELALETAQELQGVAERGFARS